MCAICLLLPLSSCTIFSTKEQDYEAIVNFFDAISLLASNCDTLNYSSLKDEIDYVTPIIDEFEEYANKSHSEYSNYYNQVLNNLWYKEFINTYVTNNADIERELSDSLLSIKHAYIISEYLSEVLDEDLPFEHYADVVKEYDETDEGNLIQHIHAAIDIAVDKGTNVCAYTGNYTNLQTRIGKTFNDSTILMDFDIVFYELPNYYLVLVANSPSLSSQPLFNTITSFEISDGNTSVILNSGYIENYFSGHSDVFFYSTKLSTLKNEKFEDIKNIIISAPSLSFKINETIVIDFTQDEIETFKENIILFDEIKKMCEFSQDFFYNP